jgi:hypothetical protein
MLVATAWAQTAPPELASVASDAPEQVLVTGQRPGPGLWKVSKGEHVLWVFGTYSPLPKKMEWRSQEVESILSHSQEYIAPPGAMAQVGFFRSLTLLPYAFGFKRNPDGAKLRDVLPESVYARWLPLKAKYIGKDDDIERERPLFAAGELYRRGLEQAGLSSGPEVRKAIEAMVKKNKIKVTSPNVELALDDPVKMIKDFKKSPLEDVACFTLTLDRLETDIDSMRVRANAWAKGDLAAIEKLSYADQDQACSEALTNSAFVKEQPGFQSMEERVQEAWLAAVEKAMAANASTFAVLPVKHLLAAKSYLSALQDKGYTVEKPE